MKGFITIEGIEGSGKSTLRSRLAEYGRQQEAEVIVTREPGATHLGRSLRNILLSPETTGLEPLAELMMFCADRAQHVGEIIRPALDRGALVICDRYVHSTLAYQGFGRGLQRESLEQISTFITGGLMPDKVLLLDLDPEVALERVANRARKSTMSINKDELESQAIIDRFERQSVDFHQRVRDGFRALAKEDADRFVILDATKKPDEIVESAISHIQSLAKH